MMNRRGFFGAIAAAISTRGLFGRALPQTVGSLMPVPVDLLADALPIADAVAEPQRTYFWPRSWTVLEGADNAGPFLQRMRELGIERELGLERSIREDGRAS